MSSSEEFPIYVSSSQGALRCLYMTQTSTVNDIKRRVEAFEGIPVAEQVVLLYGQPLHDAATLADCSVGEQTHLRVVTGAAAAAALKNSGVAKALSGNVVAAAAAAAASVVSSSSSSSSLSLTGATAPSVTIDVDDTSKRRAAAGPPPPLLDWQLVKLGLCVGALLCLFVALIGPIFDDDADTPFSSDFVAILAQGWKFVLAGGGGGAVVSAVRAARHRDAAF